MNRRPFIAGNWKMNLDRASIAALMDALRAQAESLPSVEVGVFPPYVYLPEVVRAAGGAGIVGGQDLYFEKSGAFTGQISGGMLRDVGATHVLIGHSERRHVFGESSEDTGRKVVGLKNKKRWAELDDGSIVGYTEKKDDGMEAHGVT